MIGIRVLAPSPLVDVLVVAHRRRGLSRPSDYLGKIPHICLMLPSALPFPLHALTPTYRSLLAEVSEAVRQGS